MSIPNIDELLILNKEVAVDGLGGVDLYENMIDSFEEMSLRKTLIILKIAVDEFDYYSVYTQAHILKGSASYLRADRVSLLAEKIQADVEQQLPDEAFKDYALLLKQCILLKRAVRFDILKRKGRNSLI